MGYQYDIFISYRRNSELKSWIKEHFIPILTSCVNMDLGYDPNIFLDEQLEGGETWPLSLANAIGTSRILICLWTKTYLNSKWCSIEMSQMIKREQDFGFRQIENPSGLIIPVIIHDGETIPKNISIIQKIDIKDNFSVRMSRYSESSEKLSQTIKLNSREIAASIQAAPTWTNDWCKMAANDFYKTFYLANEPFQQELTTFTKK